MTFLRDYWYPVAEAAATSAPTAVTLLGTRYVLWPSGDGAFTMADVFCPHRSAGLDGGWVDAGELVCPYHGWRFDGDGRCTAVPQMEDGLPVPPKAHLRTYPAVVRYGMVWVCVGDPVTPEPPVWREALDHPEWRFFVEFFEEWNVAAPRVIDNNLDASHPAYVHRNTFGDPNDARLPPITLEPTAGGGFVTRLYAVQKGIGRQNGAATDDETVRFERVNEIELLAPLTTRTRLSFGGNGHDYCFFGAATPVDDRRAIYMRLSALAGPEDEQPWDSFTAFGHRVKEEDRVILETTDPDFPLDVTAEVHLRSDRITLEYRRYLARLAGASAADTPSADEVMV